MASNNQVDLDGPSQVELDEVKKYIEVNGTSKLGKFVFDKLDEWKEQPINIAVTGAVGVGKSSFINTVRGLRAEDKGAAKVGRTETTRIITQYEHPHNHNLKFWDMPGVGTKEFPKDSYLSIVNFHRYDFCLICADKHFTENDVWLAKEIAKRGKPFFLIRTKIDAAIAEDKYDKPDTHDPDSVIAEIQRDIIHQLQREEIKHPQVYMISNRNAYAYDFQVLEQQLHHHLPDTKKDAWRMTLRSISIEAIREKRRILQKSVWRGALASAGAGAVPVPGLDAALEFSILSRMMIYYISAFELDETSLGNLSRSSGRSLSELRRCIPAVTNMVKSGIKSWVIAMGSSEVAESVAKYTIPLVGMLISGVLSFGIAYNTLNDILDKCEADAIKLMMAITAQ